jgi:hypothetical protein
MSRWFCRYLFLVYLYLFLFSLLLEFGIIPSSKVDHQYPARWADDSEG